MSEDATRVLVVDDEPNITELVSLGLRYEGFDVSSAHDGRGAPRAVRELKPELVILDVTMPEIDGLEVVRRMRAENIWMPVIFLTARDAVEDKIAGLTVGGDDYIAKPFSLDELVARFERWCDATISLRGRWSLGCFGMPIWCWTRTGSRSPGVPG